MADGWTPPTRRRRRVRYGALLAKLTAGGRTVARFSPERAVAERERRAKAKLLLEGGKRKGTDDYGLTAPDPTPTLPEGD